MIRYAIYTRQSVEKLADFSSCDAQFHTCQDFANAIGEPNLHWCGQRFDDEGQSGATLDRPAMRKLRKVIDLGGIDRLYAVAMDRMTRSMRDAVLLLDELAKTNVQLRLVHQPALGGGAQSRFLRHILAAFAEFERDMISSRIAESRAYLKTRGRRLAGKVPFGYDASPETMQLIPNHVEAPQVASIFERAARGALPKQIADDINDLGWRTKVYHSKRSGRITGGGKWTARQIIDTLRNFVHTGRFADGSDIRDGSHEPIVDQDVFDAAQQQLDSRRTAKRTSRISHKDLPFRQKIVCPRCGRFLTTYQVTRKTTQGLAFEEFLCPLLHSTRMQMANLIANVENGDYRIPQFQREFVWPKSKIRELFDSIYREFPIGSFFLWKAGREHNGLFRHTVTFNLPPVGEHDSISFILDGQQRITSLYVALTGMAVRCNGHVTDYGRICFDLKDERFVDRSPDNKRYVSVSDLWGPDSMTLSRQIDESYLATYDRCWRTLQTYPVSIVEVRDKDLADVCKIFQRINQSGKRLDRFDLISAMTFSLDFDLRDRFKEDILGPLEGKNFGKISPAIATQLLALDKTGQCTERHEFGLTSDDIQTRWKPVVAAILLSADTLRKNMGGQMAFTHTGRAYQQDVAALPDEAAGRQVVDDLLRD